MNEELKNKLTERFNSAYGEEVKIGLRDALRKVYLDGGEHGYQYARENLWFDAQGDIMPEYGREVIVIRRNGMICYGHRPNPKEYVVVEGKKCFAKTYDKNNWNIPDIALWLDVEIPEELIDKITTEYYKENKLPPRKED